MSELIWKYCPQIVLVQGPRYHCVLSGQITFVKYVLGGMVFLVPLSTPGNLPSQKLRSTHLCMSSVSTSHSLRDSFLLTGFFTDQLSDEYCQHLLEWIVSLFLIGKYLFLKQGTLLLHVNLSYQHSEEPEGRQMQHLLHQFPLPQCSIFNRLSFFFLNV